MNWALAFARQAESDFLVRDYLMENGGLPQCHQLHSLQMAVEKLVKAHILASGGTIRPVHGYIAKNLPVIVTRMIEKGDGARHPWLARAVRTLAERIEMLAPTMDRAGAAPSNCEYPWQVPGSAVVSPLDYDFNMRILREPAGLRTLKAARTRLAELLAELGDGPPQNGVHRG